MSHIIKMFVSKRNLARVLRDDRDKSQLTSDVGGCYKAFIPVEIVFDSLSSEELFNLLAKENLLTLRGSLDDEAGVSRSLLAPISKPGIPISDTINSQNKQMKIHKKLFGVVDLWNVNNKKRIFNLYRWSWGA